MRRVALVAALAAAWPALAAVPLSYAPSGHPTVPATIAGEGPYPFVFDTGAEGSAVYDWFARDRGLDPIEGREATVQGQTGAAAVALVRLPGFVVDGRRVETVEAVVLPDRADGVRLPGIVGLDVMGAYVVEFDPPAGRVALHPAGTSARSLGKGMRPTKAVRLPGGLLGLPVTVNGAKGIAVLDTGARDTRLNWRLARAAGLRPDSPGLSDDGVIRGATNAALVPKRGRVGTVELGGIRRTGVSARIVDLPVFEAFGVGDRPAMILGMDWLKDVHLVADFPSATVWMARRPPLRRGR